VSANDLDNARYYATQAGDLSPQYKQAYTALATAWAYIAWVDQQLDTPIPPTEE
jgi:hypothetical protein